MRTIATTIASTEPPERYEMRWSERSWSGTSSPASTTSVHCQKHIGASGKASSSESTQQMR